MKSILAALRFLTNLPLGRPADNAPFSAAGMVAAFPVAGLVIGLLLAALNLAIAHVFPDMVSALILVSILTVITGGLHNDGLADTFDGLAGSRGKPERALEIMKDSRVGTMGVLALIISFLLKAGLIISLPRDVRTAGLILMPVFGRWNMVLPMIMFPYARQTGTAAAFIGSIPKRSGIIATVCMAIPAVTAAGLTGLLLIPITAFIAWLFCLWISRRLGGGITGDVLGAVNEVSEIAFLVGLYLLKAYI